MIKRIEDNLPRVFFVAVPLAYIAFFILALPTDPQISTLYDIVFRLVEFVPFALAVTVIFIGKIILVRRSRDGKVAVWLVTVTYATGCMVMMWWGLVSLLVVNVLNLSLTPEAQGSILRGLSHALIGGGLVGEIIAAVTIAVGLKTKTLGRQIYPWIRKQH